MTQQKMTEMSQQKKQVLYSESVSSESHPDPGGYCKKNRFYIVRV